MTARSHTRTMHKLKRKLALRNHKWRARQYYRSTAIRMGHGHGKARRSEAARDARRYVDEFQGAMGND